LGTRLREGGGKKPLKKGRRDKETRPWSFLHREFQLCLLMAGSWAGGQKGHEIGTGMCPEEGDGGHAYFGKRRLRTQFRQEVRGQSHSKRVTFLKNCAKRGVVLYSEVYRVKNGTKGKKRDILRKRSFSGVGSRLVVSLVVPS